MFGKEYNVVFEYTDEVPCLDGIRFMAKFSQKNFFENYYTESVRQKQAVVAKGVSHAKGLKITHAVPIERYYEGFILAAYDSKKDVINIKKFSELVDLLISSRNGSKNGQVLKSTSKRKVFPLDSISEDFGGTS